MNTGLTLRTLASLGAQAAILGAGRYALPVRFRVHDRDVECRVPTWAAVADLVGEAGEVTLVATAESHGYLRWVFIRGPAEVVESSDWGELQPRRDHGMAPNDLYQLVRISVKRMEAVDEQHGWGRRETADF